MCSFQSSSLHRLSNRGINEQALWETPVHIADTKCEPSRSLQNLLEGKKEKKKKREWATDRE